MFDDKNKKDINELKSDDPFQGGNFSIRTMKKDLENIEHPERMKGKEESPSAPFGNDTSSGSSPKKEGGARISPFLQPESRDAQMKAPEKKPAFQENIPRPPKPIEPEKKIEFKTEPSPQKFFQRERANEPGTRNIFPNQPSFSGKMAPKKEENAPQATPEPAQEKMPVHIISGTPRSTRITKSIVLGLGVFLVLFLAGVSYFSIIKDKEQAAVETTGPAIPKTVKKEPEKPKSPEEKYLTDKANELAIDPAATDEKKFKETVKTIADKMEAQQLTAPIMFSLSDLQKNPIPFQKFAELFSVKLHPDILSIINPDFTLYVYNDGPNPRLGLAISSKDGAKLKNLLIREEKTIPQGLRIILMADQFQAPDKAFGVSNYNGNDIRYLNVTSNEDLSIDYSVIGTELFIGTSKMTLRSILDTLPKIQAGNPSQATDIPVSPSTKAAQ